jgi:hypothetical protein
MTSINAQHGTAEDRLRRLERIAAQTFVMLAGDRGFGEGPHQRYPCPDCIDGRQEYASCPRCGGRGDISAKAQATVDVWRIYQEQQEPVMETRVA